MLFTSFGFQYRWSSYKKVFQAPYTPTLYEGICLLNVLARHLLVENCQIKPVSSKQYLHKIDLRYYYYEK